MACGCTGEKPGLFGGGGKRRRRRGSSKRKSYRRRKQVGSTKKKQKMMRGGAGASLLGDPSSDVWNFTSKLLGTPGVPSMPWNQPANFSHRYGNSYIV